jgi:hypothetical protein
VRRREFITLIDGATVTWPFAARAQQPVMPVIGYLSSVSPGPFAPNLAAFRRGLGQTGFIEGRNVAIEYRWAEGHYDRLPELTAELARRKVDVIVATGSSGPAAKVTTTTIPIVTLSGGDPIQEGLVASLNRPAGNVTGVALFANSLGPKRLELLHELVPTAKLIAVMANPTNPSGNADRRDVEAAARAIGQSALRCKSKPAMFSRTGVLSQFDPQEACSKWRARCRMWRTADGSSQATRRVCQPQKIGRWMCSRYPTPALVRSSSKRSGFLSIPTCVAA